MGLSHLKWLLTRAVDVHSRRFASGIIIGILTTVLFIGGRSLSAVDASQESSLFKELKTFTDVLAIVRRDYVQEVESKKLVEGAIKGLLVNLDPHSGYLDPEFYKELQVQTKGEFGGLGIEITIREGVLVVVSPMEGSPAFKSGVKTGDAIVKIDGKFTKDFTLVDAVRKLRGPRGSTVVLAVQRKGVKGLLDIPVVRDDIQVRSVRSRYFGEGYGYVRLNQFMEKTSDDLKNALSKISAEAGADGVKGLILDVRNNPGGLLTQAIKVADLFLKDGVIVYTDGRIEGQKQKYYASPRGTEPDYPIVVIVNSGSASASEIVAGALKDHGRALIVGNQTFGKGSVQTITPLENGGALTLTTALYYTKSGQSIQVTGVKPDVEVNQANVETVVKPRAPSVPIREGDLPGAIENPSGLEDSSTGASVAPNGEEEDPILQVPLAPPDPETAPIEELLSTDNQLSKAFELVRNFNVLRSSETQTATQ